METFTQRTMMSDLSRSALFFLQKVKPSCEAAKTLGTLEEHVDQWTKPGGRLSPDKQSLAISQHCEQTESAVNEHVSLP